jgi:hypothetical protein
LNRVAEHIIHAVTKFDADGIFATLQIRRDVERVVKAGLVVFRPAGRKKIVADFFAVERQFVLAEAADIHERAFESGLHGQIRGAKAATECSCPPRRSISPASQPAKKTHRPRRGFAPRGNFSMGVPNADFPENLLR